MRKSTGAAVLATLAAAVPIVVAGVRGALDGWIPTGDDAFSGIRAWDVFTADIPLLGTWSSASTYTTLPVSHPGPLHFDLLALPVRLLGHAGGTAVGMALINALAVAGIAWLVHRLAGAPAATAAMGLSACLAWSMGSEMLYDPWNPYATLFPFALFLVAVWGLMARDRAALLVMVVAGSYVLETHLSYSLLVPGMALFGLGVVAVQLWQRRRADREAWPELRRRVLRWGGGAALLTLLLWTQPIVQQFTTAEQGNLTGLLRSAQEGTRTPGLGRTLRALGGTLAVPPAWLPPSYGEPSFELDGSGLPTWLAALGLVVLAALLAGLGRRARRRGSTAVAMGALMGLAALVLGLLTTLRAPILFEMVPTYFRWMWPMGLVLWLVVAVAVLDEITAWRSSRAADDGDAADPAWMLRLAVPGLVLALVAGVATLPRVDHGTASPPWTIAAVKAVDDDLAEALEDEDGPLLVELTIHQSSTAAGPALFAVLQDAGVDFYVEDWTLVRQLGEHRRYEEGDADRRLRITGDGSTRSARDDETLVASYSPLSRSERQELRRLDEEVTDLVEAHGLVWSGDAEQVYEAIDNPERMAELESWVKKSPKYLVESGMLRTLWLGGVPAFAGHPLLDVTVFPEPLLDRWAHLQDTQDHTLRVYLSDIEPPDDEDG